MSNEPIDVGGLPVLRSEDFVPPDPNYLRGFRYGHGILGLVLVIGGLVGIILSDERLLVGPITIGAVTIVGVAWTLRGRAIARLGYQIRERDISHRSGLIGRRVVTLPFVRVQHARVSRGAVERWLGLATLQVSSAGPDISIPGLSKDDADRLKEFVIDKAGDLVEDA